MRILLSTHHFLGYSGTEIYVITLIRKLLENNHQVVFYSKYLSSIADDLKGIPNLIVTDNLSSISNYNFDIIHTSHNINVVELKHYFPNTPLIFQSHGVKPFLEQAPVFFQNIDKYIAVSEFVKNNLIKKGVNSTSIGLIRNIVDEKLFYPLNEVHTKPKKALIFSNYNDSKKDNCLIKACRQKNIKFNFVGGVYGQVRNEELNKVLNQYDLIFTSGRGAMESLLSGRVTIIINSRNMGKIVTPRTFKKMIKGNLTGNCYHQRITIKHIIKEIEKYNSKYCHKLIDLTKKYYGANQNISKLINTYQKAIEAHQSKPFDQILNDYIFETINTVRNYDKLDYFQTKQELEIIKKSKMYYIYKLYRKIKNKIKI